MLSPRKYLSVVLLAAIAMCGSAFAQIHSSSASVQLNATMAESISVVSSNPTVNFNLVANAISVGDAPMVFQTSWTLEPSRHDVYLDAYFSDPRALVSQSGDSIPMFLVYGLVAPGVGTPAFKLPFDGFNPFAGIMPFGDLTIFDQPIDLSNLSSSRTDSVALSIDLTGNFNLPAGNYAGVLTVVATAL